MELPGLNFSPGQASQLHIWRSFGFPVSSLVFSAQSFFLVVSFGRCVFRLCCRSIGLVLQATYGGLADDFKVHQLGDRVFRFTFSSNLVGHFLYKSRSFACHQYKLFIHLWNNGFQTGS